jgi:hypothetical protein
MASVRVRLRLSSKCERHYRHSLAALLPAAESVVQRCYWHTQITELDTVGR